MSDRTRKHISVSADTYRLLVTHSLLDGVSMSSIVTAAIERYTPPLPSPRLPESLRCTGCKRATLHALVFAGPTSERWKCGECGRNKLTAVRLSEAGMDRLLDDVVPEVRR